MDMNKKDMLIAVGVVAGAAVLVLFLKNQNSASTGGNVSGGVTDIMGGFQTAGTIYVPTSSYDLQYNTYKGSVTYSSVTNNQQTTTTTTYAPVDSNNGNSGGAVTGVVLPTTPAGVSAPPTITTGSGNFINPVIQAHPAPPPAPNATTPSAPPPPPAPSSPPKPYWEGALVGGMHYATPAGGWDRNSVVDALKSRGYDASFAARANIARDMGINNYQGTAAQNKQILVNMGNAGF
jgi:pyruvate/2-oxoglutarate dehydrogenase complex dihydrolipoamide acyltransferase (E2) component